MNVVYIERDEQWRQIMLMFADIQHFKLFVTGSEQEALELVRIHKAGLILIDLLVNDNELTGLEILRRFGKNSALQNIPMAMVSADFLERGKAEATEYGAIAYLRKQFIHKELPSLMERLKK